MVEPRTSVRRAHLRRARVALSALGVLVLLVTSRTALAFCGFYVSSGDAPLVANATQVVLMREGTRTVLSMQNDYQGPPESFAMVVPVPVVLQKDNVKTLPREIFSRIDKLDAPRLVEYWERDPCGLPDVSKHGLITGARPHAASKAAGAGPGGDLGVTIEAQFTVGEYDVVVLGAKDSSGLDTWLRREGYKIPEGSEPFLRPYVQSGSKFFVARVDVIKVKWADGKVTLSPLRFHYDSAELALPIRLGLVNSAGSQDLVVHILGKGKRYEVANYPNVVIPTNLDVAESAKEQFAPFYAALFDRTVARNPKAVVTEYAWDAGSCDPCPLPPLTDAELVTLGADVMPSVASERDLMDRELLRALGADAGGPVAPPPPASGPVPRRKYYGLRSSFVLTRLHARYTRSSLGADLIFKEAPPIDGGRESPGAPEVALDTGAKVLGGAYATNTFQGRYAVRHPWTGPMSCTSPVRNVWGGPPSGIDNGGAKPAVGLAYVTRDHVQIESFLRTDVASLDLKAGGPQPSSVGVTAAASSSAASGDAGAGASVPDAKRSGCGACTASPAEGAGGAAALLAAAFTALGAARRRARRDRRGA